MSLKSALTGGDDDSGNDYLTDYTKKRLKEEAAKKAKKAAMGLGKTRGGSTSAGKEADLALQDEYESN
jgi:hypothetical protein